MKLRCLAHRHTPFKPGRFYDVAEILELPDHAMVRKPNGKWPKPGEPYFGWHADDLFEPSPEGIPAYSCGCRHEEREFFGTIIPHSVFSVPRRNPRRRLELSTVEERIEDLVCSCSSHLWWQVYRDVLQRVTFPDNLERQFLLIGGDHRCLGRSYSYHRATRDIRTILRRLKIPVSRVAPIEDQQLEFWWRCSWRKPGAWIWTWRVPTIRSPKLRSPKPTGEP